MSLLSPDLSVTKMSQANEFMPALAKIIAAQNQLNATLNKLFHAQTWDNPQATSALQAVTTPLTELCRLTGTGAELLQTIQTITRAVDPCFLMTHYFSLDTVRTIYDYLPLPDALYLSDCAPRCALAGVSHRTYKELREFQEFIRVASYYHDNLLKAFFDHADSIARMRFFKALKATLSICLERVFTSLPDRPIDLDLSDYAEGENFTNEDFSDSEGFTYRERTRNYSTFSDECITILASKKFTSLRLSYPGIGTARQLRILLSGPGMTTLRILDLRHCLCLGNPALKAIQESPLPVLEHLYIRMRESAGEHKVDGTSRRGIPCVHFVDNPIFTSEGVKEYQASMPPHHKIHVSSSRRGDLISDFL